MSRRDAIVIPRSPAATVLTQATAPRAGAVSILQLQGPETRGLLQQLTGRASWPLGRLCLANLGGIDTGLAVLWRDGAQGWAQLFPHGSPLIQRDLMQRLLELGATHHPQPPSDALYPEARCAMEADILHALSQCSSSGAIDLLLAQPDRWRQWFQEVISSEEAPSLRRRISAILERGRVLERYRFPPRVVVLGVPNVGKSTLTNRVLGHRASLVADLPGTTRDWVAGLVEWQGITVSWLDTPGLRPSADPVETQAICLAQSVMAQADLILLLRDSRHDWPDPRELPPVPCLRVWNKLDLDPHAQLPPDTLGLSAQTGRGIDTLTQTILDALGLPARDGELWAFSPMLQQCLMERNWRGLQAYLGW